MFFDIFCFSGTNEHLLPDTNTQESNFSPSDCALLLQGLTKIRLLNKILFNEHVSSMQNDYGESKGQMSCILQKFAKRGVPL